MGRLPLMKLGRYINIDRSVSKQFGSSLIDDFIQNSFEDPILREKVDSVKEVESETLTYVTNFKPNTQGTYAICLDNREARFLPKIVQVTGTSKLILIA